MRLNWETETEIERVPMSHHCFSQEFCLKQLSRDQRGIQSFWYFCFVSGIVCDMHRYKLEKNYKFYHVSVAKSISEEEIFKRILPHLIWSTFDLWNFFYNFLFKILIKNNYVLKCFCLCGFIIFSSFLSAFYAGLTFSLKDKSILYLLWELLETYWFVPITAYFSKNNILICLKLV